MRKVHLHTTAHRLVAVVAALVLAFSLVPAAAIATLTEDEDTLEVSDVMMTTLSTDDEETEDAEETSTLKDNQAQVTAQVTLSGRELHTHEFTFTLSEVDDDGDTTETRVTTNDDGLAEDDTAQGTVAFTPLSYTISSVGTETHTYRLEQEVPEDATEGVCEGVTYDTTVYTVVVTVTMDEDEAVEVSTAYYKGESATESAAVDEVTFENAYAATAELTLTAWVVLENGTLDGDDFTFDLEAVSGVDADGEDIEASTVPLPTGDDGTSVASTTNDEDGAITFPITYTQADAGCTYTYSLSQDVSTTSSAVESYDTSVCTYVVVVSDDGDGTLSFTQTVTKTTTSDDEATTEAVEDDEPVFTNVSASGALKVSKTIENGSDSASFIFEVTVSGDYVSSGGYDYTIYDSDGTAATSSSEDEDTDASTEDEDADEDEEDASTLSTLSADAQLVVDSVTYATGSALSALSTDDDVAVVADDTDDTDDTDDELTIPYSDTCGNCRWTVAEVTETTTVTDEETGEETTTSTVTGYSLTIEPLERTDSAYSRSYDYGQLASIKSEASSGSVVQPWYEYASIITEVDIEKGVTTNDGVSYMFAAMTELTEIDVSNLTVTSETNDFAYMFYFCYRLEKIEGMDEWDTSGATLMNGMFLDCIALTDLGDISDWDVSKVTNTSYMFHDCVVLKTLDLSGWSLKSATNAQHMFSSFIQDDEDTVSGINVYSRSSLYKNGYIEEDTQALTTLTLGEEFITSATTDISYMFAGCDQLSSLVTTTSTTDEDTGETTTSSVSATSTWDVSSVSAFNYLFHECSSLTTIDVSTWDTSSGTDMKRMFSGCTVLTGLDVGHFIMNKVEDTYYMFYGCKALTSLDVAYKTDEDDSSVQYWNTESLVNMYNMFQNCSNITYLDVSGWDTADVTGMYAVFSGCTKLTELDVSKWDTRSATQMDRLFTNCSKLTELDVSGWNTSKVTRMGRMFYGCSGLTELDLSSFDTTSVKGTVSSGTYYGMCEMFEGCTSLQVVKLGDDWRFYGSSTSYTESTTTCSPAYLPDPNSTTCPSGMWVRTDTTYGPYTAAELTDEVWNIADGCSASSMAGTWVWYYPAGAYQVEFSAGADEGAYEGYMATQTIDIATTTFTLPTMNYYREGYTFSGWSVVVTSGSSTTTISITCTSSDELSLSMTEDAATGQVTITWPDGATAATSLTEALSTLSEDDEEDSGDATDESTAVTTTVSAGDVITFTAQWTASTTTSSGTWTTTITLTGGQYVVFSDLPDGATYTVTETTLPTGWYQRSKSGESGTIQAAETSTAAFVNYYDPTDVTVTLSGYTYIDGEGADSSAFGVQAYTSDVDGSYDADGTAALSTTNGEAGAISLPSITYTEAGTYYYAVVQTKGSLDTLDYDDMDLDEHVVYVRVVVTDTDAVLSAEVTYSDVAFDEATDSDFTSSILFYNYTKGSLSVSKTVVDGTSATASQAFTFTISLTAASGASLEDSYAYTLTDADGETTSGTFSISEGSGTLSLKDGESVAITGISQGTTYEVTEASYSGYTTTSTGETGTISSTTSTAAFTNTYSATVTWAPDVTKVLTGGIDLKAGLFTFALKDTDYTKLLSGTNESGTYDDESGSASGDVTFSGSITYTLDDVGKTYSYYLAEDIQSTATDNGDGTYTLGDYTYDATAWTVYVTISDNGDGTLKATAEYYVSGTTTAQDSATFTNHYEHFVSLPATGATGVLAALLGAALLVAVCAGALLLHRRRRA